MRTVGFTASSMRGIILHRLNGGDESRENGGGNAGEAGEQNGIPVRPAGRRIGVQKDRFEQFAKLDERIIRERDSQWHAGSGSNDSKYGCGACHRSDVVRAGAGVPDPVFGAERPPPSR